MPECVESESQTLGEGLSHPERPPARRRCSPRGAQRSRPVVQSACIADDGRDACRLPRRRNAIASRRLPPESGAPESGAVAFGIRTHVTPLAAVAALPGEAARLAAAVRALPPEMRRYKGLHRFDAALLAWLDARAAG